MEVLFGSMKLGVNIGAFLRGACGEESEDLEALRACFGGGGEN